MKTPAAVAITVAALAGCGISVEADVPNVQVTQRGVVFSGVPGASLLGDTAMAKSFSQEHDRIEFPDGLESEVKTLSVSLRATAA